jgi:hypothetical protein
MQVPEAVDDEAAVQQSPAVRQTTHWPPWQAWQDGQLATHVPPEQHSPGWQQVLPHA